MAREFEIIGAGAISALLHRKARHAPEPGALCANCGTVLAGPYCHICGQDADDKQRSILRLTWEGVEGLTHLDGRLAQTLPLLLFNPGKLARDQMEGRRARHVPPFRLFLVSLLIFMFVLEALFHSMASQKPPAAGQRAPVVVASSVSLANGRPQFKTVTTSAATQAEQEAAIDAALKDSQSKAGRRDSKGEWLSAHLKRAVANKDYYTVVLFTWAHRGAVLLLPILAVLLSLAYIRRRKLYFYDHLIVAMQFLSFEFLIFAAAWLLPEPALGWAIFLAILWTPVNLYMTLRGAYGSGVLAAAIKTVFLWVSTMVVFWILVLGLMFLALAEM